MKAAPHRLEQAVGEADAEDVLDGLLAQEVVQADDRLLGEVAVKKVVQSRADARSVPEGFSTTIRLAPESPIAAKASMAGANTAGGSAR